MWKEFVSALNAGKDANNEFFTLAGELEKMGILNPTALKEKLIMFSADHYKLMAQIVFLIQTGQRFEGGEDKSECAFGQWIETYKTENPIINEASKEGINYHEKFHKCIADIKRFRLEELNLLAALTTYKEEMIPAADGFFNYLEKVSEEADRAENIYQKMITLGTETTRVRQLEALKLLDKIIAFNKELASQSVVSSKSDAFWSKVVAFTGMLAGFAAALTLGILLSIYLTRILKRIIRGLNDGADQVASASGEISSSSQVLAEGSSEQAASIEETSSSLEEMSSMTKQNADNANQADKLMKETNQVVNHANDSVFSLISSMEEISRASKETQKVIRSIDEIAFQTNLLALNAAVEAARAGEAGAGFAVVADEVRNLAMKSAEAARNTAELIEGTVKKVLDGSELVSQTSEAFSQVASSAAKVGELVSEIAAASHEQAQGIEQVNKAVGEMDKVTQQNAATAEESASAAEQMHAQAESMKAYVMQLVALVGGNEEVKQKLPPATPAKRTKSNLPAVRKAAAPVTGSTKKEIRPEQVIPLEEDDLMDF
ncbi:MAG: hypothetical protein JXA35_00200 [Deltaproteobacteria bacterium]|nr:hypothetical protein [Deltaproteobacteria bacterium]